jgi:ubiquinone/menaquinone biosynthesis C-methylase UbiE
VGGVNYPRGAANGNPTAGEKMTRAEDVEAGQAAYSPLVLSMYDWFVLGLSNRLIWRCPTPALRQLYDRNVAARHIDIGVGTGYFLDKAKWPVTNPSITLVDLNANSLNAASRRIRRYEPEVVTANALEPLPVSKSFRSAGLCYLLHCMPGTIPEKAVVFDHLRPLLEPGARVFGATILLGAIPRSRTAQALMNLYNRKGIFSNAGDTVEDLDAALRARFNDINVEVKGVVALFEASVP